MPSSTAPLTLLLVAFGLVPQAAPDDPVIQTRAQLEAQRRELTANIADRDWMANSGRASLVRLAVERNWEKCAANEGTALARGSEKPARLLAEAALAACKPWEKALVAALDKGAYPYVDGRVSREDMIAEVQLRSRDAALARIMLWRGVPIDGAAAARTKPTAPASTPSIAPGSRAGSPSVLLQPAFPRAPRPEPSPAADAANQTEIVVVGQPRNACRVRLAERTLSDAQLQGYARQWATAGTALRIVRPRGATYGCLAKIARQLGQYGVTLIQVVDP